MVNLKQLRILLSVAETGSLSRTSDLLRISQPAMSRHIRLLERELRTEIFRRHGRGMSLTPAGERLVGQIAAPLRELLRTIDDISRPVDTDIGGVVTMGNVPSTTPVLLPHLITAVSHAYPGITLRMIEGYPGHMIDWVQKGDIDLALVYGPGSDLHMRVEDVCWEQMVLVAEKEHPLSLDSPVPFSSLADYPLILPSREHGVLSVVVRAANRTGTALTIAHQADSAMMIKGMIQAGLGVSIMALSSVRKEVAEGQLSAAPITAPRLMRELVLALPSNRPDRPATEAVIRVFSHLVCQLADAGKWNVMPSPAMHRRFEEMPVG